MSSFLSDKFTSPSAPPPPPQQPTLSFSDTFSSSLNSTLGITPTTPAASSRSVGGLGTVNHNGKLLFLLQDVTNVCRGHIGSSAKVCCKPSAECSITRHRSNKEEDLKPGYYIKASDCEFFTDSFVPTSFVKEELGMALLSGEFKSKDAAAIVQLLNQQDTSRELDFAALQYKLKTLSEGLELKTPSFKRRKVDTVAKQFKSIVSSWQEDQNLGIKTESSNSVSKDRLIEFCDLTAICLTNDENAIRTLGQQLELLRKQIGNEQNATSYTNIWDGIQSIHTQLRALDERVTIRCISKDNVESLLDTKIAPVNSELRTLNKKASESFRVVEEKLLSLEHDNQSSTNRVSFLGSTSSYPQSSVPENKLNGILEEIRSLQEQASKVQSIVHDKRDSVTIGQYTFYSIHDLAAWCETHMPSSLPFGGFVDIYSYLERVHSYKDIAPTTVLKGMEIRQKLDLTADEAVIIESFKHALPRIFNGGSSTTNTFGSWLPRNATKDKWEDNVGLSGAKITMRDNEASIRSRVEEVIGQRLVGYQEAQSLARILLSDTITFVGALNRFISETYKRLEESGFGKVDSWKLVSKLVHRLFATNCHYKRGLVSEFLDAADAKTLSIGVLWGTLSTHQVMREYMSFGIENHPSISSEYVRFLVANCGLERINKLETVNAKLNSDITDLKKIVASNTKALSTVANKAEEALKLAKKRPRQDQA